jgi:hypothetical protein
MQISRSGGRSAVLLAGLSLCLAGCGFAAKSPSLPSGKPANLNLSLKTVPTVRSITISPDKATFGDCTGGNLSNNTASEGSRLGYPNGTCWVGESSPVKYYPIKITNSGIGSFMEVNGSNVSPSDGGNEWSLCNVGKHPAVTCDGYKNSVPGVDQYILRNFSTDGSNSTGLTGTAACDHAFGPHGKCWAAPGVSQREGFKLIGPSAPTDYSSTSWTMTITWTPVPPASN